MKRIISAILICCLILPFLPASAAEEAVAQPSIEEILNEYHEKAFETQAATENGGASTYARGGSSQTLEQETVEALTDAGYEAYNVTGENYEALEDALNTDFAEMGLDPASSYVVVISGEDPAAQSNPGARVIDPPAYDNLDGETGSDNSFIYQSDGSTYYRMRRITVTAAEDSGYCTIESKNLLSNPMADTFCDYLLNHIYFSALDAATNSNYGTLLSLIGVNIINSDLAQQAKVELNVGLNRTRIFTQVYHEDANDPVGGRFVTMFSTEYVRTNTYFDIHYYDPKLNGTRNYQTTPKVEYLYCASFQYPTMQSEAAAQQYNDEIIRLQFQPNSFYRSLNEVVGDISIYVIDGDGNYLYSDPVMTIHPYIGEFP